MFKLIKILNSGANVPEPELRPCEPNAVIDAGTCLVYDTLRNIVHACGPADTPTHLLIKDVKKGDNLALCYKLFNEMLFEAPIVGSPENVNVGMSVELAVEDGHGAYAISDNDGGSAVIYSLEGATKSGDKVLVTFNV